MAYALGDSKKSYFGAARASPYSRTGKETPMNRNSYLRTGFLLGVTAAALSGNIALADEQATDDVSPTRAVIVLAKASAPSNKANQQALIKEAISAELAEALQGIMADNKLELDMRLSGHKSEFLAADL